MLFLFGRDVAFQREEDKVLEHSEGARRGVAGDGDGDDPEVVQEGGELLVDLVPVVAGKAKLTDGWVEVSQMTGPTYARRRTRIT